MGGWSFRDRLQMAAPPLYDIFIQLTAEIAPLLHSVEEVFPGFTRHDPSHTTQIEHIAADIIVPNVADELTAEDIFILECSLWIHDAGMGRDADLDAVQKATEKYREERARTERLGQSEPECWMEYVRKYHHEFCPFIAEKYLRGRANRFEIHWIGQIAMSHGARAIHDHTVWPKSVAVGTDRAIHAPLLAAILRLSDILHFNYDRAPEFMQEHRRITNAVSVSHWKAHQVVADYQVSNDICFFDGVTKDDEAYWFAHQFTNAMEEELGYCKQMVFPLLDPPFQEPLRFSMVKNRIKPSGFEAGASPTVLRIDTTKFLEDLLTDALYAHKPTWFREILQNAFDACRDRALLDPNVTPRVRVDISTAEERIEFWDSGIGMRRNTVEQYLLVAGASYWSSDEYRGSRSVRPGHVGKFGIGFMSLFAVAEHIEIITRHTSTDEAWRFEIRDPRRVVRAESISKEEPGTSIRVRLKRGTLAAINVVELFDKTCEFPEFTVQLILDGVTEREIVGPKVPRISTSGFELLRISESAPKARLFSTDLDSDGIIGDSYLALYFLESLGAWVPHVRPLGKGWQFDHASNTYFGSISYPRLLSMDDTTGFMHIPSIGTLRLSISPNVFPLEMNLARETFISGAATRRCHREICGLLDAAVALLLHGELAEKRQCELRSAIAARYSSALMGLWLGNVPSLTSVANAPSAFHEPVAATPWPKMTKAIMQELRFLCVEINGTTRLANVNDLLKNKEMVFAFGGEKGRISKNLATTVFQFNPKALALFGGADADFGINQLRHWAAEEVLVPVDSHCRCAYGLRFGEYARPFEFWPRECEQHGLPVASGPNRYAVLDYRDFMAESQWQPTGSPEIVGVLNGRNSKVRALLVALNMIKESQEFCRIAGGIVRHLRKVLTLGKNNIYNTNNRERLASTLTKLSRAIHTHSCEIERQEEFVIGDFPTYFDGGQVAPFGRFLMSEWTIAALGEMQQKEDLRQTLA